MTRGTVHVWTIGLDGQPGCLPSLLEVLSGEERVRAGRLRTAELRCRFVTAHGALRRILGTYLDVPAAGVRFETSGAGKPYVPGSGIAFNLSHSDGVALCAVTVDAAIGVDVERIRPVADADEIVRRYFAPGEARQYGLLAPAARLAAFFSAWTRKEAFLKATGLGLQRSLASFEVELDPALPSPGLTLRDEADAGTQPFHLRSFTPRVGYAAAVALDRDIQAMTVLEWSGHEAAALADRRRATTA